MSVCVSGLFSVQTDRDKSDWGDCLSSVSALFEWQTVSVAAIHPYRQAADSVCASFISACVTHNILLVVKGLNKSQVDIYCPVLEAELSDFPLDRPVAK
jgi:hypothetical protein